jgi:peptide/nickel transport system ATP-binding protein
VSAAATIAPPGGTAAGTAPMLEIVGLSLAIDTPDGRAAILQDVDLRLERGKTLGIVGESGSGKSMLLRAVLGLAPAASTIDGTVRFAGEDLGALDDEKRRRLLGRHVGIVFQNPMTSLNPVVRIGRQIDEAARFHLGLGRREARRRAVELLGSVGIPDAGRRVDDYPHQFSGGMRQRIMIAMALACEPELFVADEATTALDVTVQRDILDLLGEIQRERHMTMIVVSHDLGVVAGRTDDVAVMYSGRIVERAPTRTLFRAYRHRYTEALLTAIPHVGHEAHARLATIPGQPPSLLDRPPGCPFAPRCGFAVEECTQAFPPTGVGATPAHTYHCYVPVDHGAVAA